MCPQPTTNHCTPHQYRYRRLLYMDADMVVTGSPGVGKTTLGDAICYEMELPFKKFTGTELNYSRVHSKKSAEW